MRVEIPVYVEESKAPGSGDSPPSYSVRPLFFPLATRNGELLQRALNRITQDIREYLLSLGELPRHDELASVLFNPPLNDHVESIRMELRRRTIKGKFLFVSFDGPGRRITFTPTFGGMWFEVMRGQNLRIRAREVLTEHYRELEKQDALRAGIESVGIKGRAWVTTVGMNVQFKQKTSQDVSGMWDLFGGQHEFSGYAELHRVGQSIDSLFPEQLDRVIGRDDEVTELTSLLERPDNRPVLMVGPRNVGKTAIVHEHVWRRLSKIKKQAKKRGRNQVWSLAPQRLIAGMKYVGQWEQRLLAIIKYAQEHDHILFFDDLVGLYRAGVTGQSDLSVAHVLKPYVERRELRVLGEITPESLRVFQELDRGFADLFQVIAVQEPDEEKNQRILIDVSRRFEGRHRCAFEMDTLPAVIDLQRRYVHDAVFPGKAAAFMERLSTRHKSGTIDRADVLNEFHLSSGMSVAFLDDHLRLSRDDVRKALAEEVVGQERAIGAMVDAVCVARARLNEPGRPLGTFLFLGPTGVGKTQCARTLATYLFGDEKRLLRFDMNAYVESDAVARLVGTFHSPEGLLTSAVRRQPFAVVLLDEIEKAHPDVFDLLLQVLGEGRLTDSLGRTTDFSNTIIILTSNLGVREAASRFGFKSDGEEQTSEADDVYIDAAEAFFRPEFFNRLDRIVPFGRLNRKQTAEIAKQQMRLIFQREGLVRRKCFLRVHPNAMSRIVDRGYHPDLGARALKRALEREVTRPIATKLAGMKPESPTVVSVYQSGETLAVDSQELINAPRIDWPPRALREMSKEELVERARVALSNCEEESLAIRPAGEVVSGKLTEADSAYYAIHEQLGHVRRRIDSMANRHRSHGMPSRPPAAAPPPRRGAPRGKSHNRGRRVWCDAPARVWQELFSAEDVRMYLKTIVSERFDRVDDDSIKGDLIELLRELISTKTMLANVQALADHPDRNSDRVVLVIQPIAQTGGAAGSIHLRNIYLAAFGKPWGYHVEDLRPEQFALGEYLVQPVDHDDPFVDVLGVGDFVVLIDGPGASTMARVETGTHLVTLPQGTLVPVRVNTVNVQSDEEPVEAVKRAIDHRGQWLNELAAGTKSLEDDPWPIRHVIRIWDTQNLNLDLRSGLMTQGWPEPDDVYTYMLSQLPMPDELM